MSNYDRTSVPIDPSTGTSINVTVDFWPYDILYVVRSSTTPNRRNIHCLQREAQGAIKMSGWIDMVSE